MKRLPALLSAVCLAAGVTTAPDPAQAEPFRAELRSGWQMQSGNQMVAVRMVLDEGWKTYWRAPGDSGIPPSFDWAGSRNVKSVQFHWPRPHVYDVAGLRTIGYKSEFVLPIEVTPIDAALPVFLKAEVDLGVCSDICIPASFRFAADLPTPGSSDETIRRALRQRPSSAKEAGLRDITCRVEPTNDGLRVTARLDLPGTGGDETVVIEAGDPTIWVSDADVARQGRRLTAVVDMIATESRGLTLQRKAIIVTVLGKHRAVEIYGCPSD